jgi:hypothetical protein
MNESLSDLQGADSPFDRPVSGWDCEAGMDTLRTKQPGRPTIMPSH